MDNSYFLNKSISASFARTYAVAAYSYMALVPIIQPPIMRTLTTKRTTN